MIEERLDALVGRAQREVDDGNIPGGQIAVAVEGEVFGPFVVGDAATDDLYTIFSATKAIVASTMWQFLEEKAIAEDTKVAEVVPEFAGNGKQDVTLQHVMLHTAGFPLAPYPQDEWHDVEARRRRFSSWRLDWVPGERYMYHATSAHWVLADIIERLSGEDFRAVVRARVLDPLGLDDVVLGVRAETGERVKTVEHRGDALTAEELKAMGLAEVPVGEVTEEAIMGFNDPSVRAAGCPGGGAVGRADQIAMFYQALLADLGGAGRLWSKDMLENVMVMRTGKLADPFTGVTANRGLGVILAGGDGRANWRGFGHTQSAETFGHNGAGGQICWADPATAVSFCFLTNGFDRNTIRQGRRGVALSSIAATVTQPAAA